MYCLRGGPRWIVGQECRRGDGQPGKGGEADTDEDGDADEEMERPSSQATKQPSSSAAKPYNHRAKPPNSYVARPPSNQASTSQPDNHSTSQTAEIAPAGTFTGQHNRQTSGATKSTWKHCTQPMTRTTDVRLIVIAIKKYNFPPKHP